MDWDNEASEYAEQAGRLFRLLGLAAPKRVEIAGDGNGASRNEISGSSGGNLQQQLYLLSLMFDDVKFRNALRLINRGSVR